MNKEEIISKLAAHSITLISESRVNNCGDKLVLSNGAIVNLFDSGKINYQGKNANIVKEIITNNPKYAARQALKTLIKIANTADASANNRFFKLG